MRSAGLSLTHSLWIIYDTTKTKKSQRSQKFPQYVMDMLKELKDEQDMEIINSFKSDNPEAQVCMLTGIRGSGKTVTMTAIANNFRIQLND